MGLMNFWFWPFGMFVGFFMILIGLLVFAFWIWMIVDAAKRKFKNDTEKILWIIITILGGWLGALIYLLVIRMSNPKGLFKK